MLRGNLASADDESETIRRTGSGGHSGFGRGTVAVLPIICTANVLIEGVSASADALADFESNHEY